MKNILFIFDMDGLLLDTERLAVEAWEKAGKEFGICIEKEILLKTVGLDVKKTKRVLQKEYGKKFPYYEIRNKRLDIVNQRIDKEGIKLKEGALELLKLLDKMKIKKIIATSTAKKRAINKLKITNIFNYFDDIVCGDEVKKGKPNPEIFIKAAQKLNIPKKDCIVLEDSKNGAIAAIRCKMKVIIIPDLVIPDKKILKKCFGYYKSLNDVIVNINKILN